MILTLLIFVAVAFGHELDLNFQDVEKKYHIYGDMRTRGPVIIGQGRDGIGMISTIKV